MFPMPMPEMPQDIMDAVAANPDGFAEAMGQGMELQHLIGMINID